MRLLTVAGGWAHARCAPAGARGSGARRAERRGRKEGDNKIRSTVAAAPPRLRPRPRVPRPAAARSATPVPPNQILHDLLIMDLVILTFRADSELGGGADFYMEFSSSFV